MRRFVHTSTVGVHGDVKNPPADENAEVAPSDIYQETKAEADAMAREFGRTRAIEVAIVRPGAIYGPGETRLLKVFRGIARGRYAVVGSGKPHYHLVYIDDLVDGFLLALDRPEAAGETFIIAGPTSLSQDDLAREVAQAKQSGIVHAMKYYPAGATTNSGAGITRLERVYPALEAMEKHDVPLLGRAASRTARISFRWRPR